MSRWDALGAAGEALAHAKLKETLEWLCGSDYYLHEGPLVVEHAPGTTFSTAEIDHLAVTPFGIFIFETKNWSGRISPSSAQGMLTRVAGNGQAEDRRSPLYQNRTKVAFFRSRLPANWPITGAGLFTSPEAQLDPRLNANLLSLADIPQWLRTRRDAYAGLLPIDITRAAAAIALYSESSPAALEAHKRRVKV
ncbi:nuclease-related domain-containing protein [Paraburkholderia domus]|uniref:nuclease-related domain-containing protein n=1 Tax=Paraburkholderia domus TaxID=2793075 RepID=UPI001EF06797|nr:nuclease-related domain-containing protein [Paraburkholderia domus]